MVNCQQKKFNVYQHQISCMIVLIFVSIITTCICIGVGIGMCWKICIRGACTLRGHAEQAAGAQGTCGSCGLHYEMVCTCMRHEEGPCA